MLRGLYSDPSLHVKETTIEAQEGAIQYFIPGNAIETNSGRHTTNKKQTFHSGGNIYFVFNICNLVY